MCDIFALSPFVPSPKFHRNVMGSASGSDDWEPSTVTNPELELYGPPATATGGWFGGGGGGTGGDGGVTPLLHAAPATQNSTRYLKRDIATVSRDRFQILNP